MAGKIGVIETLQANKGIAFGAVAGHYLSGAAIGAVEKGVSGVAGNIAGKWLSVGAAVAVAATSIYLGKRFNKTQMGVAFGGVALGHAISAAVGAFKA